MREVNADLLFEFPFYKMEVNLNGIETIVDDTKITVVENGCMLRFDDMDCLAYNANLHLAFLYKKTAKELSDLGYEMRISDPSGKVLFQEAAVTTNGKSSINVRVCNDTDTKYLLNRVLFKDINSGSTKGRNWDGALTELP